MTELLGQAIAQLRSLDAERQNEIATSLIEDLEYEKKWAVAFASSQNLFIDLAAEAMAEEYAGPTQVFSLETL